MLAWLPYCRLPLNIAAAAAATVSVYHLVQAELNFVALCGSSRRFWEMHPEILLTRAL